MGIVVNDGQFDIMQFGELVYIVEVQCMVEDGMVCVVGDDSGF